MKHEKIQLNSATLTTYVIDNSEEIDANRRRPAVIICPGGGYEFLSDREAEPIAIKMMSLGYQAFVLHYSIKPAVFPTALTELAQAVQLVRQQQDAWHINPDKVIVAGFSAGGHLAASLGVFWQADFLAELMTGAKEEWQPNGLLLSYPVLSSGPFGHEGSFRSLLAEQYEQFKEQVSLENCVTADTPPTFIWHTLEDGAVPAENSLLFTQKMRELEIPFELHLFPKGGHGLGLGTIETVAGGSYGIEPSIQAWPQLFADWLEANF